MRLNDFQLSIETKNNIQLPSGFHRGKQKDQNYICFESKSTTITTEQEGCSCVFSRF